MQSVSVNLIIQTSIPTETELTLDSATNPHLFTYVSDALIGANMDVGNVMDEIFFEGSDSSICDEDDLYNGKDTNVGALKYNDCKMCDDDKIIKSINSKMEEYLNNIVNDFFESSKSKKKTKKQPTNDIPTFDNCDSMLQHTYNIKLLKNISKHYKLKVSGNKTALFKRIFVFLKLSSKAVKIQKVFRGHLQRLVNELRGPAFRLANRCECVNDTDFLTGDEVDKIPYVQFFSYRDNDNFIYCFDMLSFNNLVISILKDKRELLNPYNRLLIPDKIIKNMRTLINISKMLHNPIDLKIAQVDCSQNIGMRVNAIFHTIDDLGNYSNIDWFNSLNRALLIKFLFELKDIWDYRAQLDEVVKTLICPPHGNPFIGVNFFSLRGKGFLEIKNIAIDIMERILNSDSSREYKCLGAYYILGAITLVNVCAANSMPWLHQSLHIG